MRENDYPYQHMTAELEQTLVQLDCRALDRFITLIPRARRIFVAGAGRSGLMARAFAMRLMHMGFQVFVVGDVTTPAVTSDDLLVVASGSGKTAGMLAIADKAKQCGAKLVLITIQSDSPIAKNADVVVVIPAPTPKIDNQALQAVSIQPMGSLFEQSLLLVLDGIIIKLMAALHVTEDQMFSNHANLE